MTCRRQKSLYDSQKFATTHTAYTTFITISDVVSLFMSSIFSLSEESQTISRNSTRTKAVVGIQLYLFVLKSVAPRA